MLTRQQFASADNQQGTNPWIAWMAGVVDGEGSIGIYDRKLKGTNYINWSIRITITNTNIAMLDKFKEILDRCGLAYYVAENQKHGKPSWRPRWQMLFTGFSRAYLFLKLIEPYLVAKKCEVDLALEFLESRMSHTRNTPYTERELEIIQELREAKRTGHLRD